MEHWLIRPISQPHDNESLPHACCRAPDQMSASHFERGRADAQPFGCLTQAYTKLQLQILQLQALPWLPRVSRPLPLEAPTTHVCKMQQQNQPLSVLVMHKTILQCSLCIQSYGTHCNTLNGEAAFDPEDRTGGMAVEHLPIHDTSFLNADFLCTGNFREERI